MATQLTDHDLVVQTQQGDPAAAAILYDRYFPLVWRFVVVRTTNDRGAAEDIVSETFLTAFRRIGVYDDRKGNVPSWLLGIARNKLRSHQRRASPDLIGAECQEFFQESEDHDDPVVAAETKQLVHKILDNMPDENRVVLEWRYLEGLTVPEIATRCGRSTRSVEGLLYRGRKLFRRLLASRDSQPLK